MNFRLGPPRKSNSRGGSTRFITSTALISAIDGICPHQGGPLADGIVEGTTVTCPWHGWQFDIRSGKTPLGPKIKQPVYEVKIEDQDVLVAVP